MAMLRAMILRGTTNSSGAATVVGDHAISGLLYAVAYDKGSFDSGVDVALSTSGANGAQTLLTLTNADSSAMYYPRHDGCDNVGAALSAKAELPLLVGTPQIVVAQGGNAKTGGVTLWFYEG